MPGLQLIMPDWPAPKRVRAFSTTRSGGVSSGNFCSLNLAKHVGDSLEAVLSNREILNQQLPIEPLWLEQVHGSTVVNAACTCPDAQADASISRMSNRICTVMSADCLPVLLCDTTASVVAAVHAGWKGLASGVLENAVKSMQVEPGTILAWLGPAISQAEYEVGDDVRDAFLSCSTDAQYAFLPGRVAGKWQLDFSRLARQRLAQLGIHSVFGGDRCTYSDPENFFSARRDGMNTGRQASLIWLE